MARRIYVDTHSGEVWDRPTRHRVLRFPFDRGSTEPIELQFVTDGVVDAAGGIADGSPTLTIKDVAGPAGVLLVAQVTASKSGSTFTFYPYIMADALDTYLGSADSAAVVAEITWTDTSTEPDTHGVAQIPGARVYQNANRGSETVPGITLPWVTLTSADTGTTLAAGVQYLADTTAAAFTVNLPLSPDVGDELTIADAQETWATNNLTVGRNGQLINGDAEALTCNISMRISLVFVGGAQGWEVY